MPCACQHLQTGKPGGYELIKEEDNRRGKTREEIKLKTERGLVREAKYFLRLAQTFGKREDKTKWSGKQE